MKVKVVCRSTARSHNAATWRRRYRNWASSQITRIIPSEDRNTAPIIPSSSTFLTALADGSVVFSVDIPKPRDLQDLDSVVVQAFSEVLDEMLEDESLIPALASKPQDLEALKSMILIPILEESMSSGEELRWFNQNRYISLSLKKEASSGPDAPEETYTLYCFLHSTHDTTREEQ